jgi:hypothetical protein
MCDMGNMLIRHVEENGPSAQREEDICIPREQEWRIEERLSLRSFADEKLDFDKGETASLLLFHFSRCAPIHLVRQSKETLFREPRGYASRQLTIRTRIHPQIEIMYIGIRDCSTTCIGDGQFSSPQNKP